MNHLDSKVGPRIVLSALLMPKIDSSKKGALDEIISRVAFNAFKAYRNCNWIAFDALVGETSCQLRAVKIAQLAESQTFAAAISERLKRLEPLGDVTEDEAFLILSHLLYLTRDAKEPSKTNEQNLMLQSLPLPIDLRDLESFVWRAKEELAIRSIQFLRSILPALPVEPNQKDILRRLTTDQNILVATKLPCTACYFNLQILLEHIRQTGSPIVLKASLANGSVFKIALHSEDRVAFKPCDPLTSTAKKVAVVFAGASLSQLPLDAFKEKLLLGDDKISRFPYSRVMEILLANAAKHPQYAGKNKESPIPLFNKKKDHLQLMTLLNAAWERSQQHPEENIEKLLQAVAGSDKKHYQNLCNPTPIADIVLAFIRMMELKSRAELEGLCKENSALFCIEHIYPSQEAKESAEVKPLSDILNKGASL